MLKSPAAASIETWQGGRYSSVGLALTGDRVMKWYFCMESTGFLRFQPCLQAALQSCRQNTSLEPVCVWYDPNGQIQPEPAALFERYGVKVLHGQAIIYHLALQQKEKIKIALNHAVAGSYLRYEIPFLAPDEEFAFYTDVDVLFRSDIDISQIRPRFLAAGPEFSPEGWGDFNSGIMVMNLPNLRDTFPGFAEVALSRMRAGFCVASDQGDLNAFYFKEWERLPIEYNWKPYWGRNDDAKIIHFHGPKPDDYYFILTGELDHGLWAKLISANVDGYRYYMQEFLATLNSAGYEWVPQQLLRSRIV
jgi:hypothetical protein